MIKLRFDLSEAFHANEHTLYANCGLHIHFWNFWQMLFCFMMKKDHFKQKLLLWTQFPFKQNLVNLWKFDTPVAVTQVFLKRDSLFVMTRSTQVRSLLKHAASYLKFSRWKKSVKSYSFLFSEVTLTLSSKGSLPVLSLKLLPK